MLRLYSDLTGPFHKETLQQLKGKDVKKEECFPSAASVFYVFPLSSLYRVCCGKGQK